MKTKTTATIAVAVVAIMVLSVAVSTTYSWFSDTEETRITLTTATVDIEAGIVEEDDTLADTMTLDMVLANWSSEEMTYRIVNKSVIADDVGVQVRTWAKISVKDSNGTDLEFGSDTNIGQYMNIVFDGEKYPLSKAVDGTIGLTSWEPWAKGQDGKYADKDHRVQFVAESLLNASDVKITVTIESEAVQGNAIAQAVGFTYVDGGDNIVTSTVLGNSGDDVPVKVSFTNGLVNNAQYTLRFKSTDALGYGFGPDTFAVDFELRDSSGQEVTGPFKAEITYTLPAPIASNVVYHVDDNGGMTKVDATATDGVVEFIATGFSKYMVYDGVVSNSNMLVKIMEDLDEVVINLVPGNYTTNFKVKGGSDITISGTKDAVLSGQIATTSSTAGTITLQGVTVKVDDSIVDSMGISQTSKSAIAIWGNQTVVCNKVTFDMSLADGTAITSWWDTGVGTTIEVHDCTFNCNGQRPIRATGNVTVEGCTFNDPYRYAVQLTAKASTATELEKAVINFNDNTIVNGANGKAFVYGIQLEGADYGCNNCVINGSGNTIVDGGVDSTMYFCECGKVDHGTITWNVEGAPAHEGGYNIFDSDDLREFASKVNGGETFSKKIVYLCNDINLNNEEWTPIGNSTNSFQGTFDGQGCTISNLEITGNNSNVGLFGYTTNGEIKNLVVENAKVSGRLNVGVVAGTPYTSKYTNITVTGYVEVNGFAYVGGVGGKNAYANWTDITVDVDETSYVKADSVENGTAYRTYVGGVIGFMGEGDHVFKNITSNIDVTGSTIDVGGITGIAHYGNSFINCSSSGDVTITNATEASDAEEMGGIAGVWHNQNDTTVTFDACVFTGTLEANVEGVDLKDNVIVGSAYSSTGTGKLIIYSVLEVGSGDSLNIDSEQLDDTRLVNRGTVTMNGGTITNSDSSVTRAVFENYGMATLTDVEMEGGSSGDYGNILKRDSTTVYNNVDVISAGGGIGIIDGAKATFNSGSVYVDTASTSGRYLFYLEGTDSELTINGGTFSWDPKDNQKRAYVYAGKGTTVYITGGVFGEASSRSGYTAGLLGEGDIIITGGTFGFDPTGWVKEGYEAVRSGDTWTVSQS